MAALVLGAVSAAGVVAQPAGSSVGKGVLFRLAGGGSVTPKDGQAIPPTSAALYQPSGVAIDSAGDVYLADSHHNKVDEISAATGKLSVLVGGGSTLPTSSGITPLSAQLSFPTGLALDPTGDLFISDTEQNEVLELSSSSRKLRVVAGGGRRTPSASPVAATTASLSYPAGLATDAEGDLFVAEEGGDRVDEVTGGQLSVLAGRGAASGADSPMTPTGLVADTDGTLFIANQAGGTVDRLRLSTDTLAVVAGGGSSPPPVSGQPVSPRSARLKPLGVTLDKSGDLYLSDTAAIDELNAATGLLAVVAGGGSSQVTTTGISPSSALLASPSGLAFDREGNLVLAQAHHAEIDELTAAPPAPPYAVKLKTASGEASLSWAAPSNDGGSAVSGYSVAVYRDGALVTKRAVTATAIVLGRLAPGSGYVFGVAAENSLGASQLTRTEAVTIPKWPSKVALGLSVKQVTFGQEERELLTVTASGQDGSPAGTVTITGASCVLRLTSGRASCRLKEKQLAVGSHTLVATYGGNGSYEASHSAGEVLRVIK